MGLLLFFVFGGVACIGAKFYRDFKDSKSTDERKKNKAITFAIIGLVGMILSFQFKEPPNKHGNTSSTSTTSEFKNISKESFCGTEFKHPHHIEQIDMYVESITVLNCDGTYTSKQNWETSKENEQTYRNVAGRSSDQNYNFYGTWKIVENNIPSEVEYFFSHGGFKSGEYTIIKYNSNNGKSRYAYIQHDSQVRGLYLGLVTFSRDNNSDGVYEPEKLDMFEGLNK